MIMTRTLLLTAMLGLAAPAFANAHMEAKKDGAAASTKHDGMADHHKMDTSKMTAEEKAAHDKMMKDAAKTDAAADKPVQPK